MRGTLIVISGSSGVGKSTVISKVLAERPDMYFSISCTTRAPRKGEVDGESYFFLSKEEFQEKIRQGEFLEYAEYVGNYYGTPKGPIEEKLKAGIDVLLDIEVKGASNVRRQLPEASTLFIIPPSWEELERRLRERGTDSEETIAGRMETAKKEAKEIVNYDYIVLNDEVDHAVNEILSILTAESCRTAKRFYLVKGE